jgi:hypothetical protein
MKELWIEDYYRRAVANPEDAPLPRRRGTAVRVVQFAAAHVDSVTLPLFMKYLIRMKRSWQVLFAIMLVGRENHNKGVMASDCKAFCDWVVDNADQL